MMKVTLSVTDQNAKDILWLMFDRFEFEDAELAQQSALRRLEDFGMLDSKIISFEPGLAHCYFLAKESDGERKLEDLLTQIENSSDEYI